MSERSVMMIQMGARRNYIHARQLETAGLLHSLVCDAAWPEGQAGWPVRVAKRSSSRLAGRITRRTVAGVAASRIRASIVPTLVSYAKRFVNMERSFSLTDEALGLHAWRQGLEGVEIIVNSFGNGGSFLAFAKNRGVKIVTDFISHPKYWQIVAEERNRWPGWEFRTDLAANDQIYRKRLENLLEISDIYLCPSVTVARELAGMPGSDPSRIRIVPYGANGVRPRIPSVTRGRVLFAASAANITKGIPYLALAAEQLQEMKTGIEIVVAGSVSPAVLARPEVKALTFLGSLDRDRMSEEFSRADVFCLPSLAEGSATVVFEALANGVPVVTTASSGSVVTDGIEGFIVPERSAQSLANAILTIVDDRKLRWSMSEAALAAAARYSDDICGAAFVDNIRMLMQSPPENSELTDKWS